jgi:hypothetical protein
VKIEYLSDLELDDDRFNYKGRSYRYKLIDGITFEAVHTRHSVNGVPTGSRDYVSCKPSPLARNGTNCAGKATHLSLYFVQFVL